MSQVRDVCSVSVSVVNGQPVCSPSPIVVKGRNALIVFNLAAEDYMFPVEGALTIKDPGKEFPDTWYISPIQIAVRDKNSGTEPSTYSYTLLVENLYTKQQLRHDPMIINEPGGPGTP